MEVDGQMMEAIWWVRLFQSAAAQGKIEAEKVVVWVLG